MMKFRFRRQGADPQREKLKQELFAFHKTVEHGFPNQPSALAFDPELRIMAIGTRSGAVKIYGAPGVEFTGLHRDAATVTQMHFLPGQGRVLTLLDDDSLHLWEIVHHDGCAHLEEAIHFQAPSRPGFDGASGLPSLAHITVVLLVAAGDMAALGTEGGSIFFLDVPTLTLLEGQTLGPDEVLRSVPDDYRCGKALGPVESLQGHLRDPTKILIGYSRGLLVIWNQAARCAERIFLGNQQLESVCWERSGHTVVSSHSDGSYAIWAADTGDSPTAQPTVATTPYGPFPCKAINKVLWRSCASGEHFVIFSGGMPRASYGDRHCVSVLQAETLVTLDFTSRVIDFFTVHSTRPEDEFDEPQALAVLLEEELVVLDLQTPGWPAVPAPYLAPLHSSAITCSAHVANVPAKLWARIVSAGEQQSPQPASGASSWPITGGRNLAQEPSQRGLLLTGHEDGTVRFWDASGVALRPLYKLCTAGLFQTDCEHADSLAQAAEDDWPPFRKVGCFDPYSDDPRLGVQKVALCKYTAQMVVAGTAGQVLVLELSDTPAEQTVGVASLDLLQDREGFTWKGHERLSPRLGPLPWPAGFQPRALVQCLPPAAVTAVTLHAEWGLVAFGTSHGFGLFDYLRRSPVLARCTLHPSDSLAMEGPLSRVKSLKKSLRQSFRRIRKSRASGKKRTVAGSKLQEANAQLAEQAGPQDVEVTPVQRRIEPRSADDSLSGVVRCLYFADTFLRDAAHHGPTMWAGTNSGSVFAYALEVPAAVAGGEKRPERAVEAVLGKEVQLMHRAPVVAIAVLDGRGRPLPEPYEASRDLAQAPDMQGGHAVLIASEEQFKVFTLPKVSAKTKFKLTAHEGCRVRKVALATFASVACEDYTETCLACLTNLGDVHVFSVPGLRPQVHYACIRKEDISGIASCVFTRHGQGFYLISPSEFERFSLSARNITEPLCSLDVRWPRGATHISHRSRESPKLSQANGTPGIILAPQSCDGSPDPICKEADTPAPGSGAGAGGAGTGDPGGGGGGGGRGKPRGRSCGCGARGPERPPSPERGPAGRPPPLRMSHCSSRALTLLSSVFGACGLLLVGIAVSTDYWLYMEEGTVLPQNQTTEVKMALHAGLWRVCFFAGREKGRCVASEYFLEPEINLVTENTENILKTVRTATPFPMVSLFLVFTAFVISNIGHIRPQRTILAFVSGIFFILSGLSLVVGLVLYISSINDEVMNRPSSSEQYFHYRYGWSFAFAASSFLLKEGAGVMSVYLFTKRYAEEEMYRPHPAFYRPRLSDCSDYSGQFLQPEAWRRGRSPSDISSDVSIQMTQNYPPAIKYPDHLHISTSPC